jgi:hypothetical protein
MFVLTFFNLGSGATTILGAMQILSKYLAWGVGGSVQLMLFLLQAGLAARRTPLRKWFAVMLLAAASVYTSFFTYYGELAKEANEARSLDLAAAAHHRLVSEVYGPMRDRLRNLQQEAVTLRETTKAEEEKGISTGQVGFGEQARTYYKLALEKETEAKNFAQTVEELRSKFEYDLKGLAPEDILNNDRKALSVAPAEFRNNYPELERGDYIDEDLEMSLLAPYLKVKNREEAALLSLLIALGVDGMAIMLGTAIVTRSIPPEERRSAFTVFADSIVSLIRDVKQLFTRVNDAAKESSQGRQDDDSNASVEDVIFTVKGKGSDFLNNFYHAISDTEPHIINFSTLTKKNGADEKTQIALRALVDKLKQPNRKWVQRDEKNTQWVVASQHYHQLVSWLQKEIQRQENLETEAKSKTGKSYWIPSETEETPVEIKIPLSPNSQN